MKGVIVMKRIINNIAQKMKGTSWYFCQLSKKMVLQINKYIDEQINESYESIKTGKPKQDRKTKAKLRFFSGIVFIGCVVLLVGMPVGSLVSALKDRIIESTIKSPDELLLNLSNNYIENYPEIQVIFDDYTRTESVTMQHEAVESKKDDVKNDNTND